MTTIIAKNNNKKETMGGVEESSIDIDGNCIHHPIIQIRRKTSKTESGWKTLLQSCPLCSVRGTTPRRLRGGGAKNHKDGSDSSLCKNKDGMRRSSLTISASSRSTAAPNPAAAEAEGRASIPDRNIRERRRSSRRSTLTQSGGSNVSSSAATAAANEITRNQNNHSSSTHASGSSEDYHDENADSISPLYSRKSSADSGGFMPVMPLCKEVTTTTTTGLSKGLQTMLQLTTDSSHSHRPGDRTDITVSTCSATSSSQQSFRSVGGLSSMSSALGSLVNGSTPSCQTSYKSFHQQQQSQQQVHQQSQPQQSLSLSSSRSGMSRSLNRGVVDNDSLGDRLAGLANLGSSNVNSNSSSRSRRNTYLQRSSQSLGGLSSNQGGVWRYGDEQQQEQEENTSSESQSRHTHSSNRPSLSRQMSSSVGGIPSNSNEGGIWRYGDQDQDSNNKNHNSTLGESSPTILEHCHPCSAPSPPTSSQRSSNGSSASSSRLRRKSSTGSRPLQLTRQSSARSLQSRSSRGSNSSSRENPPPSYAASYSPPSSNSSNSDKAVVCGLRYLNPTNNRRGSYTGQIHPESGVPHGIGTLRYTDGTVCEGEWIAGVRSSSGQQQPPPSPLSIQDSTGSSRSKGSKSRRRGSTGRHKNLESYNDLVRSDKFALPDLQEGGASSGSWCQPCDDNNTTANNYPRSPQPSLPRSPNDSAYQAESPQQQQQQQLPLICSPCISSPPPPPPQSSGNNVHFKGNDTTKHGSRKKGAGPYSARESKGMLPPAPPLVSHHSPPIGSGSNGIKSSSRSPSSSSLGNKNDFPSTSRNLNKSYESLIRARNVLERKNVHNTNTNDDDYRNRGSRQHHQQGGGGVKRVEHVPRRRSVR